MFPQNIHPLIEKPFHHGVLFYKHSIAIGPGLNDNPLNPGITSI